MPSTVDRLPGDVRRTSVSAVGSAVLQHRVGGDAAGDAELQRVGGAGQRGRVADLAVVDPGAAGDAGRGAGLEHAVAGARGHARHAVAVDRQRQVGRPARCGVSPRDAAVLHAAGRVDEGRRARRPGRRTGSRRRRRCGWPPTSSCCADRAELARPGRALGVGVAGVAGGDHAPRAPAAAARRRRPARSRSASSRCGWRRPRAGWSAARISPASARSARAAAAGSSLARSTRLPLVSRSCASLSSTWRFCRRLDAGLVGRGRC